VPREPARSPGKARRAERGGRTARTQFQISPCHCAGIVQWAGKKCFSPRCTNPVSDFALPARAFFLFAEPRLPADFTFAFGLRLVAAVGAFFLRGLGAFFPDCTFFGGTFWMVDISYRFRMTLRRFG